jgi:hypothetical protein
MMDADEYIEDMTDQFKGFMERAFDWNAERKLYRRVLIQLVLQHEGCLKVDSALGHEAQRLADDQGTVLLMGGREIVIESRKRLAALAENGEHT